MPCVKRGEPSLNEINVPVFRTNRLILELPQQTMMVRCSDELQGLACTGPQGAWGMDERGHNTTEMHNEHRLHFH
jgi:hypothetical protein